MNFPALLLLSAAAGAAACTRPPAEAEVGVQSEITDAGLELPQTPAGAAARGFFGAFNSDDPERMRAFVQEFAGPDPHRSLDERVQGYRSPYEQVGFLQPLSIGSSTDAVLVVRARSALEGELYLIFIVDPQPPHRLQGIHFERADR